MRSRHVRVRRRPYAARLTGWGNFARLRFGDLPLSAYFHRGVTRVNADASCTGYQVLHNVAGKLGVLEGNGGALRTGLPWQSDHDGERFVHELLRITAAVGTPIAAINIIITKHESLRNLVDDGWVYLFAMAEAPAPLQRYRGAMQWENAA